PDKKAAISGRLFAIMIKLVIYFPGACEGAFFTGKEVSFLYFILANLIFPILVGLIVAGFAHWLNKR
ncbi:type I toxin-antitoxin system Fst family toxin, partial [Lentilactobacillus kisonensis]|uniref:type I toxin-antitoxin system Fst family toxin n=1 Tax=Lentilactobacillus kisonensis TaxID=481722 RepID=UPI000A3FE15F